MIAKSAFAEMDKVSQMLSCFFRFDIVLLFYCICSFDVRMLMVRLAQLSSSLPVSARRSSAGSWRSSVSTSLYRMIRVSVRLVNKVTYMFCLGKY